jgi:transposase
LSLGIDISKNKAHVCLKKHSEIMERFIVTNNEIGFSILLHRLKPYIKKRKQFLVKAAIESTGNLWMNMYEALEQHGIDI